MTNEIKIGETTFSPDTHCVDADTGLDVWSFSPGMVREMLAESDKQACGAYSIAGFKPWEATHLKTGNVYQVIGEAVDATNAASNRAMVIYRGNGQTFVRCAEEFMEKFEDRYASVERKRVFEIRKQRDELRAALKAILASDRTRIGINEYNAAKAAIASAEQPATATTWQQRLIAEKVEIDNRIEKLRTFLCNPHPEIAYDDEMLLIKQGRAMQAYSDVLEKRIARIGGVV